MTTLKEPNPVPKRAIKVIGGIVYECDDKGQPLIRQPGMSKAIVIPEE